ncbi:hypothetical protein [uncultured Paraglaciecola sp.]|uniref:hypothetical protein n=1 Tax=uncultured Paraglaciecola sp. TaxID=1765024 RepID=UPI0026060C4C|nr:hypothetical protein [uncultured Paraglaciecola sp.]
MEAKDYHVGLVRGFILGQNAPTIVLHALDCIVDGVKSRAGEKIGRAEAMVTEKSENIKTTQIEPEVIIPIKKKRLGDEPDHMEERKKRSRYTAADTELMKQMYQRGDSVIDIANHFKRKPADIYSKLNYMGVKRK